MIKNKALTLAFMISTSILAQSVYGQDYTTVKQDPIHVEDSLTTIAAKSIWVAPLGLGDDKENDPANQREIKFGLAVETALEDQVNFKKKVIDSPTFEYDKSENAHEAAFYSIVSESYKGEPWILDTQGNPLREISSNIFKASSNHLAKSQERGEWMPDNGETNKVFTLVNNQKGQLSLLIKDLDLVLPTYSEHRIMPRDENNYAYAPHGRAFTKKQYNSLLFLNRLLTEKPANRFKSGLLFLIQNPDEPFASLWDKLEGKNIKQLPSPINYDEAYGKLKIVFDYHRGGGIKQLQDGNEPQILQRALTRVKWNWDKTPDTNPLMFSWEEVVGKPWNFYLTSSQTLQDVTQQLLYTFEYHVVRRVPDYENLKDFEKMEVIRVARNFYLQGEATRHKNKPDTDELKTAIALFKTYPI